MTVADTTIQKQPLVDSEIPELHEHATPEEKDQHWFKHVYQGDRVPQLTLRAVLMGAVLGMLMSVSNLYTTMKVGWSFGVAITSCVLSYVIWNSFRALTGGGISKMSILENNCMQSTASAAGASTGATIATMFGALFILDDQHRHQPWWIIASFTLATASMGVFLAIPMKRQMINQEQLPFPSGIAAATTLRSLYSHGAEAMKKAYSLVIGLFVGVVVGILNTDEEQFVWLGKIFKWMREHIFNIHLPEQVPANGFFKLDAGNKMGIGTAIDEHGDTVWGTALSTTPGKPLQGFGFEPSVLLIAAGMIVGMRVSLSMLAAAAALYFGFAPWLNGLDAQHAGEAVFSLNLPMGGGGAFLAPTRWALWGGTSIMVFASLTSLALQWKTIARSFVMLKNRGTSVSAEIDERMAQIEVPGSWMIAGMIPITLAMLAVQIIAFHIHWWAGLIAVGMSFVLSLVASRATGETDTTPIGAMGKVMQLMFALIMPKQIIPNLVSAGIAANSASSSADLLTDLKSGYLLGANPRRQFLAQFFGVFFGTLAVVPAWYLMIPNIAALEKYPLPATQTWVAVARVLSQGVESLPISARWAILIGAGVGVLLPILERLFPKARPWMPSAMGLGLGWVVFFSNALAFTLGALIAWVWKLMAPKNQETYYIPIASGLVAGESLVKAILAMLATAIGLIAAAPPAPTAQTQPAAAATVQVAPAVPNAPLPSPAAQGTTTTPPR